MLRTHHCGELNGEHIGQEISLCGWLHRVRDIGQLIFIQLRDRYGITQCLFECDDSEHPLLKEMRSFGLEDCLKIKGKVRARADKDVNPEMQTGNIEVVIESITCLNSCSELPFQVKDDVKVSDDLRLKYRYLDLRRPKMQSNLLTRHKVIQIAREALCAQGFLEIETPLLVRSTPEGARDFVVPSRLHPGKFYALPQSPQLYKQMLMISGADRYFQFAPAFRDEDLRADRVPVHTQIDMEMTFVEEKDVYQAVEQYVGAIFKQIKGLDLATPFRIMSYKDAMETYGCDKPDTRFGMHLHTLTDIFKDSDFKVFSGAACVRAIVVPQAEGISRKDIDGPLLDIAKKSGAKGLAWSRYALDDSAGDKSSGSFSGGVAKFLTPKTEQIASALGLKNGDLLLFAADSYGICCRSLSALRLHIAKQLGLIDYSRFDFLWVNEFPLFEYDEDSGKYFAMHHLFTKPMDEDMPYLDSDPAKVRGQLYDLVLNGVELLSGSIRINTPQLQEKVLQIVDMPQEEAQSKFGFLLESFKYGAPPHGGSALGLDRLVAILCGEESIREVIAYPPNNTGVFPLDASPAPIDAHQMQELYLNHLPLPQSVQPSKD